MVSEFLGITAGQLTAIIAVRYLLLSGLFHWLLWQRGGEKLRAKRLNRDRPMRAIVIPGDTALAPLVGRLRRAGRPRACGFTARRDCPRNRNVIGALMAACPICFLSFFIYLAECRMPTTTGRTGLCITRGFSAGCMPGITARPSQRHLHHSRSILAEAALAGWLLPAMVFVIPIHIVLLVALLLFMSVVAVFNHSGWEILPRWLACAALSAASLFRPRTTATITSASTRITGLYFRFWDRIMGTDTMPQDAPPANAGSVMRPGQA